MASLCNIMQAHRECLAIRIILLNFTFINHFRMIMKKYANNSNIHSEDKPKQSRQTSKNKEIENYLSTHYDFRFNTVLGRTEFSPKYANLYSKVSRYDINTFRRELDTLLPLIIFIPSSRAAFRHVSIPYRTISGLCQRLMLQKCSTR